MLAFGTNRVGQLSMECTVHLQPANNSYKIYFVGFLKSLPLFCTSVAYFSPLISELASQCS